jgi:hypothetical protein
VVSRLVRDRLVLGEPTNGRLLLAWLILGHPGRVQADEESGRPGDAWRRHGGRRRSSRRRGSRSHPPRQIRPGPRRSPRNRPC